MRRALAYAIFAVATIAIAIAAYYRYDARDAQVAPSGGGALFPDLKAALNQVTKVRGVLPEGPFTLVNSSGQWVVVERGNYRADQAKVKQTLLGLAELQRREPKTAKPERYASLGLGAPGSKDSKAIQIVVEDGNAAVLADLIVGVRRTSRGRPDASEIYVRVPDDPQSWMVEGSLPRIAELVDWLDENLVEFDARRVRYVQVTHGDGQVMRVTRKPGFEQGYALEGVPEGREVDSFFTVRNVATGIAKFPLDDVVMNPELDPDADNALKIVVQMYDGLRITMSGNKTGDTAAMALQASYQADLAEHSAPADELVDDERPDDTIVRLDKAAVEAEVTRLNGAWGGRVFLLDNWRIATADKRVEEFLKPLPEAAAPASTEGAAPASQGGQSTGEAAGQATGAAQDAATN